MEERKKILILIDWYLPGRKAGGPVKSVESFVWAMKDYFECFILTRNTDLGSDKPYDHILTDQWTEREDGSKVMYLNTEVLSAQYLQEKINSLNYDFLYLNSYYSKWFSIVPLRLFKKGKIKGKVVLASRGMLSHGALQIKPLKKKVFIRISAISGLHNKIRWHASYQEEVNEIKKYYGADADVVMAGNFSKPVKTNSSAAPKQKGELRLFYLSRVSRVKNLHLALLALKELKAEGKIVYDIYGAIEDDFYKTECDEIIKQLTGSVSVSFKGEIANHDLGTVLPEYHFLFLPTSNENFGHSIFEALQCACPVIISNKTPWRNLQKENAGWDVEPEPAALITVLEKALNMEQQEFAAMSASALSLAKSKATDTERIESTLKLFS